MPKEPELGPSEDEPENEVKEEQEIFDLKINKAELDELLSVLNQKKKRLDEDAVRVHGSERRKLLSQRAAVLGSIIGKTEGLAPQESEK